ncbi:MAG: glycosyltransferase family 9 protein [Verrucomicrobiae bacterium]|nr:glycosyltransferase family 9 protein [Verrucomicrobiae bacterium]
MKILIVRLSALGDVIQGIPFLVALKESFPDWEISWLVENTHAPVLQGHPCLDELFVLDRDWRRKKLGTSAADWLRGGAAAWKICRQLRRKRFDAAIDLQGLFKSGLWCRLSGAPRRIGHDRTRECAHWFLNEYVCDRPTFDPSFPLVKRYLEPARYLGANLKKARYLLPPATPETVAGVDALLGKNPISTIAFCPWSAWASKNWPLACWQELGDALAKEHRVLILGGPGDVETADPLWPTRPGSQPAHDPGIFNLTGQVSLAELAEVFRRCRLVIGPDTGPVHMANATGVPRVLMLFGSTSWRRSGPFGENHRALYHSLECQPCFERLCPLGHGDCLRLLDTPQVLNAAREMIH